MWISTVAYPSVCITGKGIALGMSLVNESDLVAHYSRHTPKSQVFPLGITKQFQLSIPRELYDQSEFRALPSEDGALPGSLHCKLGTIYVGSTSFAAAFDVRYNALPAVRGSFFLVNWDHVAQSPLPVPQLIVNEGLAAIERRGEVNTKPEILKASEFRDAAVFSSRMTVVPECCDLFDHANYKTYIVKAFDCVREMHDGGILTFQETRQFADIKVKGFTIVFDQQGFLNEMVDFSLIRPPSAIDNAVEGVAYKEDERVVHFRIEFYEPIKWRA